MFEDRIDAGCQLAKALADLAADNPIIYALPRGGLPVAAEVARALHAPLELMMVRKIGVPSQPEVAMGGIVDGDTPIIVLNEDIIESLNVPMSVVHARANLELKEIKRRRALYLGNRPELNVAGRTAIIVDDGIATGATAKAAIRALKQRRAKRIIVAVPVATRTAIQDLEREADEVRCLDVPDWFRGVGAFYQDFHQLKDHDVLVILEQFPKAA